MFIQRQNHLSTILSHETKQALPYIKQNLQATCLYVTVEFTILRSQGRVKLNISMICGGGADEEQNFSEEEQKRSQKNKTPSISGSRSRSAHLFRYKG